jgi:osmotically-inducible protein OsmY
VKLTLLFHRHVNAGATTVAVRDGVVTLTGTSTSDAQKDLTGAYAKDIDGVKEVQNHLTVTAQPETPGRTDIQKIDDASVTAQVKTALRNHRSTSAIRTGVETRNGVVTLTGKAKNAAEKTLVTKMATDIQGVVDVDNRMTIE